MRLRNHPSWSVENQTRDMCSYFFSARWFLQASETHAARNCCGVPASATLAARNSFVFRRVRSLCYFPPQAVRQVWTQLRHPWGPAHLHDDHTHAQYIEEARNPCIPNTCSPKPWIPVFWYLSLSLHFMSLSALLYMFSGPQRPICAHKTNPGLKRHTLPTRRPWRPEPFTKRKAWA